MNPNKTDTSDNKFTRLSDKQRACLDLVLQRQTSKQIARKLGISKAAVDQRLTTARHVLGAEDREAAVLIYSSLLSTYDRVAYDAMGVPPPIAPDQELTSKVETSRSFELREAPTQFAAFANSERRMLPLSGVSINDLGTLGRIGIIVGLTIAILVVVLVGLAVAQALSKVL